MGILYVPKNKQRTIDITVVDEKFEPHFKVTGHTGHKNDVIYVYDLQNNELARIRQTSTGIIPRFQLLNNDNYVASFSFSVGKLADIIFIRHLNWIVTGEISAGNYRIRYGRKRLLTVRPVELASGYFSQLEIALDKQSAAHVAIVTLLDSWSLIKKHGRKKFINPKRHTKFQLAFKSFSKLD